MLAAVISLVVLPPIALVAYLAYYQYKENLRNSPTGTRKIPGPGGMHVIRLEGDIFHDC
jgi:hypothetical protein